MTRLLIVILIIIVIAFLWYQWQERLKAEERRRTDEARLAAGSRSPRQPLPEIVEPAPASRPAAPIETRRDEGVIGRFQEAADVAAGVEYEEAADRIEGLTADLVAARREAEAAAARLAARADEALAEVRAAADEGLAEDAEAGEIIDAETVLIRDRDAVDGVPPGAIRGDGGRDCPPIYPIKVNRRAMRYYEPGMPDYEVTVPEFCFSSVETATGAGYSAAGE